MINNYLAQQIKENFPYPPTIEQEKTIECLAAFVTRVKGESAFVLRGYAGTGKTSVVSALVKTLDMFGEKVVLLAPTGRAAKVFANYSHHSTYTIHKKIYRQKTLSGSEASFSLNRNLFVNTLFIIDEASMISNEYSTSNIFGTGRLLDDLITYVYSSKGCGLLFLGDTAQLPPVGEEESPALSPAFLSGYGLNVECVEMTQVVRQARECGILCNATLLREHITMESFYVIPTFNLQFPDIKPISPVELLDTLSDCYSRYGMDQTTLICYSNRKANIYNNQIRSRVLWRENELDTGDLLMVVKNNYYWPNEEPDMDFIANGELAVARRIRHTREMYGFRFADVTLRFPDQDELELDVTLLLDTLGANTPALSKEDNDRLFYAVLQDYADIPLKRNRMQKMKTDPHFNALQVKYAYAITCHKAQGGQWENVFLDYPPLPADQYTPHYFRWLYTAFTRATKTLYLISPRFSPY